MFLVFFTTLRFRLSKSSRNATFFALKDSISCEMQFLVISTPKKSSINDSVYKVLAHVRILLILFPRVSIPQGIELSFNSMSRPGDFRFAESSRNVTFPALKR